LKVCPSDSGIRGVIYLGFGEGASVSEDYLAPGEKPHPQARIDGSAGIGRAYSAGGSLSKQLGGDFEAGVSFSVLGFGPEVSTKPGGGSQNASVPVGQDVHNPLRLRGPLQNPVSKAPLPVRDHVQIANQNKAGTSASADAGIPFDIPSWSYQPMIVREKMGPFYTIPFLIGP
jgi:hypothetical protein